MENRELYIKPIVLGTPGSVGGTYAAKVAGVNWEHVHSSRPDVLQPLNPHKFPQLWTLWTQSLKGKPDLYQCRPSSSRDWCGSCADQ
eukprot:6420338-Amphidinium_carterae.1